MRSLCLIGLTFTVVMSGVLPLMAKPSKMLTVADAVAQNKIMTHMNDLIVGAGIDGFLRGKGPFTLFVPSDSAFVKYSPDQWLLLIQPENKREMQRIVLFHLLNGKRLFERDMVTQKIISCQGSILAIKRSRQGLVTIENGHLVNPDIRCSNGVIHEIDTVLIPPGPSLPPLPHSYA